MRLQKGFDPNMNWHLVWRTFLKTWRGYKFIFEIESENPFWPGGQNYLEMKHRNDLDKCLNFSISIFPSKDAWWSILSQYIKCPKNICSWEKIWMHKKIRNYVRIKTKWKCSLYKVTQKNVYFRKNMHQLKSSYVPHMLHCTYTLGYMLQPIHY